MLSRSPTISVPACPSHASTSLHWRSRSSAPVPPPSSPRPNETSSSPPCPIPHSAPRPSDPTFPPSSLHPHATQPLVVATEPGNSNTRALPLSPPRSCPLPSSSPSHAHLCPPPPPRFRPARSPSPTFHSHHPTFHPPHSSASTAPSGATAPPLYPSVGCAIAFSISTITDAALAQITAARRLDRLGQSHSPSRQSGPPPRQRRGSTGDGRRKSRHKVLVDFPTGHHPSRYTPPPAAARSPPSRMRRNPAHSSSELPSISALHRCRDIRTRSQQSSLGRFHGSIQNCRSAENLPDPAVKNTGNTSSINSIFATPPPT